MSHVHPITPNDYNVYPNPSINAAIIDLNHKIT